MFAATVFVRGAKVRVSVAVTHFVAAEVLHMPSLIMMRVEMLAVRWIFAMPAVVVIVVVIDVSPEMRRTVVPGARADKDAAGEPLGPIVAIRRALVGRIVEIAIGAFGRRPNLYRDLCVRLLG